MSIVAGKPVVVGVDPDQPVDTCSLIWICILDNSQRCFHKTFVESYISIMCSTDAQISVLTNVKHTKAGCQMHGRAHLGDIHVHQVILWDVPSGFLGHFHMGSNLDFSLSKKKVASN